MTTPTSGTAPLAGAPVGGEAAPAAAAASPTAGGQRESDERLGVAVRAARHAAGLTLVQLAALAGLSHPFLSQIENGRSRPSMRSLFQIAEALGTTQQALMAAGAPAADAAPPDAPDAVTTGAPVGLDGGGGARLLLHDASGVDLTEFRSPPSRFGDFFRHDRQELLYVVAGSLELQTRTSDADGRPGPVRTRLLGPCATASYGGDTEHRWRQVGEVPAVVLVVHTPPAPSGGHGGGHSGGHGG